jgi:hypothetical protein
MITPTRTFNPLHFEDLDPRRFEDLALQLVYKAREWEDIHHDGRSGSDDGVDIRAVERTMDGALRYWFGPQCAGAREGLRGQRGMYQLPRKLLELCGILGDEAIRRRGLLALG